MVTSTTFDAKSSSANVIEVSDSDNEPSITKSLPSDRLDSSNISLSTCSLAEKGKNSNTNCVENNEEDLDLGEDVLLPVTFKRKRTCNVVRSESERDDDEDEYDDSDDNVPISKLIGTKKETTRECENNEENLDFGEDVLFPVTFKRKRTCNVVRSESERDDDEDDDDDDNVPISKLIGTKKETTRECENNEENLDFGEDVLFPVTFKRKRTCNVVRSESERDDDEDDDNVPITKLIRTKRVSRRECQSKSQDNNKSSCRIRKVKHQQSTPTKIDADDEESEEDLSKGSSSGFIVDDSDVSSCEDMSSKSIDEVDSGSSNLQDSEVSSNVSESQNVSDGDMDYEEKGKNCDNNHAQNNKENLDCEVIISNSKSNAAANVDDDDDNDDVPRCHLKRLRKCASNSEDEKTSSWGPHDVKAQQSIPTILDGNADDEQEEYSSSNEEENYLNGFIVDDASDVSNKSQDGIDGNMVDTDISTSQDSQNNNNGSDSQDVSDRDINFGKILSQIQRRKGQKMKWEFEADMLAEFGKDTVLCMKAVCALNRQQSSAERMSKRALCQNKRGFSRFDAERGSNLADFLTDGDPYGSLKKTVEELEGYDPEAVALCRHLAFHYSKQLYDIYKNKEDPLFP